MKKVLRRVLFGGVALVVLCVALPSTVQADQRRDGDDQREWREQVAQPPYRYYMPPYRYYRPGYRNYVPWSGDYYYYPRFRQYYGVPGYRYYGYPGRGGAVHVGPVHVWW